MVHGEPCCKIKRYPIHKYSHVQPWIMISSPRYLGVPYRTLFFSRTQDTAPLETAISLSHLRGTLLRYLLLYRLRDLCDMVSPAKTKGHGVTKVISRQGLINVIISIIILLPSIDSLGSAVFQKKKKGEKTKNQKIDTVPSSLIGSSGHPRSSAVPPPILIS